MLMPMLARNMFNVAPPRSAGPAVLTSFSFSSFDEDDTKGGLATDFKIGAQVSQSVRAGHRDRRSNVRYWIASLTCAASICPAPARSAIVRAILSTRW